MNTRPWLTNVQDALNDAHMMVTDKVRLIDGRDFTPDELSLLDRIDSAILHVQSMRTIERVHGQKVPVRR